MCANGNQNSWWSTTLSLYIYHLISYMNKFRNHVIVNFISVSCISRRQLFILVRNKSVVLLLWMISFMVTLRLWMSYSYFNIDDSSLIIYKICNAKNNPNLIITLPFKSWMVWWSLEILDLLTHANHAPLGEMTETSHSGKTKFAMIVVYHT